MGKPICSFPGCGIKVHTLASGLCSGHWRQQSHGQTLRRILRTPEERFFAKVNKTDTCWLWTGATNHLGYPQIWVSEERRVVMAHRVSVRMSGRTIPEGYEVDHLCRVPACVNPDHLEPVTHAVNMERAPWSAVEYQLEKTHCPQGHPYSAANTRHKRNSSGGLSRECKACRAEGQRRRRARRKALRMLAA